jgi:thymidylate synthase
MELITGQTSPSVWLAAVEHLDGLPKGEDFDVILHVAQPTVLTAEDRRIYDEVDSFLTVHGAFSVHTVAETIFPLDEYQRNGARGVFDSYPEKLRGIQKARDDGNWGSYSYRMLRQKDAAGATFNPLEDMLKKIKAHHRYRASFELSQGHPFEDEIPIYDPVTDRKRLYGGPCLSHLSIKVHDGLLRFNATYRSHYYVRRLLGNLVGLGRLQFFLAHEAGLRVGALTINSTFARLDTGSGEGSGGHWSKADARALIARCRAFYDDAHAAA